MDICGSHNKTSHNKDGAPYLVKGKELILASENKDGVEIISVPSGKSFNYNPHHVLLLSLQALRELFQPQYPYLLAFLLLMG